MSRILKRPMFRKGGEVMEGIMTGIKPRTNYAVGSDATAYLRTGINQNLNNNNNTNSSYSFMNPNIEQNMQMATELYKRAFEGAAPTKDEILAKMLISGGLGGLSETGGGSTLANLAKAFKKPAEEAITESFMGKRMGQQAAGKGVEYALGLELQKAKASNKELFREQLVESQVNKLLDSVKGNPFVAAAYAKNYNKLKQAVGSGIDIDILTDANIDQKNGRIKPDYFKNKDNIIYIDPFTNRFMKIKNGQPVQIDQTTFQEMK